MTAPIPSLELEDLQAFYRTHIQEVLWPFWERAQDLDKGGVFTCFDHLGERLLSRHKYIWSQGRFLWVLSRLLEQAQAGLLTLDAAALRAQAERTRDFLYRAAFLPGGNCAFVVNEAESPIEPIPGKGYDTSVFVDCFVVLGLTEWARVSGDFTAYSRAYNHFFAIRERMSSEEARSEPYPVPEGVWLHSFPMILLNIGQELGVTAERFGKDDIAIDPLRDAVEADVESIIHKFVQADNTIAEIFSEDHRVMQSLWGRHRNPGHAIECMWFLVAAGRWLGREDWIEIAGKVVRRNLAIGWDEQHGGLLHYVDCEGGVPQGPRCGLGFEELVVSSWDDKLWWVHIESLYAIALLAQEQGWPQWRQEYDRLHAYSFATFPHPNRSIGEWIQIRNRDGSPADKVVALPVKDPYHILRGCLLMSQLS